MALTTTAVLVLVAIYIRVSTEDQARRGYSIPEQRVACLEMARRIAEQEEQRLGRPVQLQTVSSPIPSPANSERRSESAEFGSNGSRRCVSRPDRFSRHSAAIIVANGSERRHSPAVCAATAETPEGRLFSTWPHQSTTKPSS